MARHGENIRKRKDGRWEGRYLIYSEMKEKPLYCSIYGKTYEEVKEKLMVQKIRIRELAITYEKNKEMTADEKLKEMAVKNTTIRTEMQNGGIDAKTEIDNRKEREVIAEEKAEKENNMEEWMIEGKIMKQWTAEKRNAGERNTEERMTGENAVEEKMIEETSSEAEIPDSRIAVRKTSEKEPSEKELSEKETSIYEITEKELSNETCKKVPDKSIKFEIAAGEWLAKIKAERKHSTYVKYQLIYQHYIEKKLGDMEISDITQQILHIQIFDSLSESIEKSIYCVINQILKYASEKYALKLLPLKRPEAHVVKKPVETFSRKEQSRLLSVIYQDMDSFKAAVLLCLHTGLRLGELCALRWEDIDTENQMIAVNRTVQRLYAEGYSTKTILLETEPKSMYSRREIPFSAVMVKVIRPLHEGKKYVFGGDKPVEPRTMQNHFKKMLEKANIENKNFHTLRHTFSTNCIEEGTDVKSLSEILGHSDVQITLNRYVHPSMDTKRKYLESLSGFYGRICGQDLEKQEENGKKTRKNTEEEKRKKINCK